jgi:hypothetical protein
VVDRVASAGGGDPPPAARQKTLHTGESSADYDIPCFEDPSMNRSMFRLGVGVILAARALAAMGDARAAAGCAGRSGRSGAGAYLTTVTVLRE